MIADKKRAKKFIAGILLCILILILHPIWLPLPASFLLVKDNVHAADVIIILSGDWEFRREAKAIELYKAHYADKILRVFEKENRGFDVIKKLLNSNATQEEAYKRYFGLNGISQDSIVLVKADVTSTFDELKAAKDIVLRNRFRAIILVTSDYHMRRALMTARWIFKRHGVTIYPATIHSKYFRPDRWWLYEEDIRGVIFEYLSIGLYVAYHFTTGK